MGIKKNNILVFLYIGFFFFLMACGTSKKSSVPKESSGAGLPPVVDSVIVLKDTLPLENNKPDKFTIALLLPLQLEEHFANDTNPDTAPYIIPEALPAIHFFEGALLAKSYLSEQMVELNYKIIDTGFDSLKTISTLNTEKMADADAVISMLPANYNNALGQASERWKKPVYFFQASNTQILEKYKNLNLLSPSNNTQIRQTAAFLAEHYPASNFITVFREQRNENDIAALFAGVMDSIKGNSSCVKVNYKTDGWNSLKGRLIKNKRNVLIIPTSDEAFLSAILNKIREVKTDYSFMLCGMPSWENFGALDPELMKELNAVFFSGMFVEIEAAEAIAFRKKFIATYHADPLLQGFMSYEVITTLAAEKFKNKAGRTIVSSDLLFHAKESTRLVPVCEGCGKERKSVNVVKFDDYKFVRLK